MKTINDTYKLQNGIEIPIIGFGTWKIENPKDAYNSVLEALKAGYRHIDTASIYNNEESVGRAINDSGIPRNEIFLTTKLWNDAHTYKKAMEAIDISLRKLKTDYVDLYLVHWPNPLMYRDTFEKSLDETWQAMEEIYKNGKAKAIGISNFRPHHIETLLKVANIAPMVNQIKLHPGNEPIETIQKSLSHGMIIQAYSPLGSGQIFDSKELQEIAKKYNKSVAQICIRYILQKGYNPLPKSQTKERIIENINVFDFNIDDEDMLKIQSIPNICKEATNPDLANY